MMSQYLLNAFIALLFVIGCFTTSCTILYYTWVLRYKDELEKEKKEVQFPIVRDKLEARDPTLTFWLDKLNKDK